MDKIANEIDELTVFAADHTQYEDFERETLLDMYILEQSILRMINQITFWNDIVKYQNDQNSIMVLIENMLATRSLRHFAE